MTVNNNYCAMTDADGNVVEDLDKARKFLLDDALISYKDGYAVTLTYTRDGVEGIQNANCQRHDVTVSA